MSFDDTRFDDTRNGADSAWQRLLSLLGLPRGAPQPSDPTADYQAMIARNARLPKVGGLFGGDYARFMADAATRLRATSPSSAFGGASLSNEGAEYNARPQSNDGALLDHALFDRQSAGGALVDRGLAGPNDGAEFLEIGNPANRRLRREWERQNGRPWPRDPTTGRNYDVAHIKGIADGGTNTLDNIRPMHPADHLREHMANGDFARWARRAAIARAFGGSVAHGAAPLEILSGALGILSGRVRTDSFDNFANDYFGFPSREDKRKAFEQWQKQIDPDWKPGDLAI